MNKNMLKTLNQRFNEASTKFVPCSIYTSSICIHVAKSKNQNNLDSFFLNDLNKAECVLFSIHNGTNLSPVDIWFCTRASI